MKKRLICYTTVIDYITYDSDMEEYRPANTFSILSRNCKVNITIPGPHGYDIDRCFLLVEAAVKAKIFKKVKLGSKALYRKLLSSPKHRVELYFPLVTKQVCDKSIKSIWLGVTSRIIGGDDRFDQTGWTCKELTGDLVFTSSDCLTEYLRLNIGYGEVTSKMVQRISNRRKRVNSLSENGFTSYLFEEDYVLEINADDQTVYCKDVPVYYHAANPNVIAHIGRITSWAGYSLSLVD